MLENVAIRILVGIVVIALGFMVLKYVTSAEKEQKVEYKAPAGIKKVIGKLNLPKGILKKHGAPKNTNKYVSFAPSATDATLSEYGAWDTNRNSSSGIMNNMNNVGALTSSQMAPMTPPVVSAVHQPASVPMIDGYAGDDDTFGSEL